MDYVSVTTAKEHTVSKPEIITVAEMLKRINLSSLLTDDEYGRGDDLVGWDGYPVPFACGHTAVRGFGPMAEGGTKNEDRIYKERVRISQYICGGHVLFSFPRYAKERSGGHYQLNSSVVIVIAEVPDGHDTCLRMSYTA